MKPTLQYKLLAIDPSSSATGWAMLRWQRPPDNPFGQIELLNAGVAKPARRDMPTWPKIHSIAVGMYVVACEHPRPDMIVIEWPDSLPGTGSKAGAKASLAIWGASAGAIAEGFASRGYEIDAVTVGTWTRAVSKACRGIGGEPKERRAFWASASLPNLPPLAALHKDAGHDLTDAASLGLWYIQRLQNAALMEGATR